MPAGSLAHCIAKSHENPSSDYAFVGSAFQAAAGLLPGVLIFDEISNLPCNEQH